MRTSVHELAPSPSHELRHRDERQHLLEALRRLPLDLQVVLELHYWEGLRGPELAEVLEIPEGTVRSRLRLGRDRLRRCLAELEGQRRASGDPGDPAADLEAWADALRERAGPGVESTD
jgi:RNA polymerase sigma-70 factor (ECF subfamily)